MLATVPVDNDPGTSVLGPWTVNNTDTTVLFTFANWPQTFTIALTVDVSLDGATSWVPLVAMGAASGGAPGRFPVSCGADIPIVCATCGHLYTFGAPAGALTHSTVALNPGVTLAQIGQVVPFPVVSTASFLTRILVDDNGVDVDAQYVTRTFHTPTPVVTPLRQIRSSLIVAGGHITSTLTVSST